MIRDDEFIEHGNEEKYIPVKVTSKYSRLLGRPAMWHAHRDRIDKNGQAWYLLEFYDGFRCWFPRDEFEVLGIDNKKN